MLCAFCRLRTSHCSLRSTHITLSPDMSVHLVVAKQRDPACPAAKKNCGRRVHQVARHVAACSCVDCTTLPLKSTFLATCLPSVPSSGVPCASRSTSISTSPSQSFSRDASCSEGEASYPFPMVTSLTSPFRYGAICAFVCLSRLLEAKEKGCSDQCSK